MKKLQLLLLLIFFNLGFAQVDADNRFSKSETETTTTEINNQEADGNILNNGDEPQSGPGNPGEDPVPVDQYVGFLLVTAVGFILYTTQKKRKFLSKNNNL